MTMDLNSLLIPSPLGFLESDILQLFHSILCIVVLQFGLGETDLVVLSFCLLEGRSR